MCLAAFFFLLKFLARLWGFVCKKNVISDTVSAQSTITEKWNEQSNIE